MTLELPLPTNPSDFRAYVDALLDGLRQSSPERATQAQAKLIGQVTGLALSTNQKIFEAMALASKDVREGKTVGPIYAVQAPTGAGKTTGACALVAAQFDHDHTYSAAIVTSTIQGAQDTFDTLAEFIDAEEICLLTSAHQRSDVAAVRKQFGESVANHIATYGPATVEKLTSSPIAISTHERWKADTVAGDRGVLYFNKKRRHNVIVDEQPDLVSSFHVTPADIEQLREQLVSRPECKPFASIVGAIAERLRTEFDRPGSPLEAAAHLVGHDEVEPLLKIDRGSLDHLDDTAFMAFNFMEAACTGNCFIFRDGRAEPKTGVRRSTTFWSYLPGFRPHSGIIILDATATLSPLTLLSDNARFYEVQQPDYRDLDLIHIEPPSEFDEVARSRKSRRNTRQDADYLAWVGKVVEENTAKNDKVLVVLHKRHVGTEMPPMTIDRDVSYAHWGHGIGSNEWRDCTHVFLFSEYHMPKAVHICEAATLHNEAIDVAIEHATRRSGIFEDANTKHRLRWFKQMACRGTIRKIGANGVCSPMKLFTTMDRRLLVEHWRELFPGSPEPRCDLSHAAKPAKKPDRLAHYLLAAQRDGVTRIAARTVADDLGISVRAVRVAFEGAGCSYMRAFGWRYPLGEKSIYREPGGQHWSRKCDQKAGTIA